MYQIKSLLTVLLAGLLFVTSSVISENQYKVTRNMFKNILDSSLDGSSGPKIIIPFANTREEMNKGSLLTRKEKRQIFPPRIGGVPLTPIIDASHPHTDACTLNSCQFKCIARNFQTCIPLCVNYACYCKCPNPDIPKENFTPEPLIKLVPDVHYDTQIDHLRPPSDNFGLTYPPQYNHHGFSQGQRYSSQWYGQGGSDNSKFQYTPGGVHG